MRRPLDQGFHRLKVNLFASSFRRLVYFIYNEKYAMVLTVRYIKGCKTRRDLGALCINTTLFQLEYWLSLFVYTFAKCDR